TENVADLTRFIYFQEKVTALSQPGTTEHIHNLNNLANVLSLRYLRKKDLADMNLAIQLLEQALEGIELDAAERPQIMTNLGKAFKKRYEHTEDLEDL